MQNIEKYSKRTRRNPSVREGLKSRLPNTPCMEKTLHFVFRLSLKNAFTVISDFLKTCKLKDLKLHQFCKMQVQDCCCSAATANWLLQLQTGYMLPLLGKLLQLATASGYCHCYCKRATCYCNYCTNWLLQLQTGYLLLATATLTGYWPRYCYCYWLLATPTATCNCYCCFLEGWKKKQEWETK